MPRAKKSKKRSSSIGGDWRPRFVYFIDNALGRYDVPDALRPLGVPVKLHTDHYDHDAEDTEWIPKATAEGWVILTKDRDIRHNPLELATVIDSCACYVCVRGADRKGSEIGANVARFIRKIDDIASAATWPVLLRVTSSELTVLVDEKWIPATAQHMNPKFWRRRTYRR